MRTSRFVALGVAIFLLAAAGSTWAPCPAWADQPAADSDAPAAATETKPAVAAYHEALRPQFHFTPRKNWTNDPNGLVYYDGEYHLFFQHNPHGINWGNMTWGHAVSKDLVHWQQLEHAILPDELGTIFSGSAVVDENNTAGFQTGEHKVIVAAYTYAGDFGTPKRPFTQAIAYSNDRGRTFTKFEGNPVVDHILAANRDPKVFWHAASGKWIMALYLDVGKFVLLGSPDLKEWTKLSDVAFPKGHECPEFFELPVDGNADDTRWVFWEGGGRHLIGRFDGTTFTPESEVLRSEWGTNCYAGQTWNNVPDDDGRRIFIAWMRGGQYPEMPFNQQMTVPREFTLRTTHDGVRLFAMPVAEIEQLREQRHEWKSEPLAVGENPLADIKGDLFDIDLAIRPGEAESIELDIRGQKIRYDVAKGELSRRDRVAPLPLDDGLLTLRVLVDRTSIEVFANGGRVVMSYCFVPAADNKSLSLTARGGSAQIESLDVYELRSIWE
ncbi:MAG: glycoside hydrolase family 32 protein [Planctomycetota bacterium]|nr:MAG: glycoside hydrolase family 32 protein [Planctomycetota bacterium]REJ86656.1 MAG: glycoside hydrolase family 32 protein [Planctomycetota bacterium]